MSCRRPIILAPLLASLSLACQAQSGERSLAEVAAALDKGQKTANEVLTDPALMGLHASPRFRELIRRHAPTTHLTLVSAQEPGQPLVLTGTVRGADGKPVGGALLYFFHTDATGRYTPTKTMDEGHARLFGYLRTGPDGRYELRTIRPGGYPGTVEIRGEQRNIPEHIHLEISASGHRGLRTQINFADDPRMQSAWAKEGGQRSGFPLVELRRETSGIQRGVCDLRLE
jgi:protocatechuate 3,4-dioxygenase beta subunit